MKAVIQSWQVDERGPALHTREQHADGSVSYQAAFNVSLNFQVVGNDANEFVEHIKSMVPGSRLQEIQLGMTPSKLRKKLTGIRAGRKYVFE